MKMLPVLLLSAVVMFLCGTPLFARVTVRNRTPYEIKLRVDFDGGSECFPKGAVSKNDEVNDPKPGSGIQAGASCTRRKDAAQIKRDWHIWAYLGNTWVKVKHRHWARGGAFVHADVFMSTDPATGENRFDIHVGGN